MLRDPEDTDATLLKKLRHRPTDPAAWQEFVRRYSPRIYSYCLAFPLQPADAEDVSQAVLLKLVNKLSSFNYDPSQSFRGWLRTLTRNVLLDFLAERGQAQGSGDSDVRRLLENVEAREGLVKQLEAEFDQELLDIALRHVQRIVTEQQWQAFRLSALEGLSGAEVGVRLGMLIATVYTAKSKVQKLVREEIARLEEKLDRA